MARCLQAIIHEGVNPDQAQAIYDDMVRKGK